MPQAVGIEMGDGGRIVDLAREPNTPRGAFVLSIAQAGLQAGPPGRQGRGLGDGGRATNMRSRRMRCARPAWLRMIRSDRAVSGSSVRARSNWARPTITASGLLSSWPAPPANSPSASSFASRSRSSSVSILSRTVATIVRTRAVKDRAIGNDGRPRFPGQVRRGTGEPGCPAARTSIAPELDQRPGPSVGLQWEHERGRSRILGQRLRSLWVRRWIGCCLLARWGEVRRPIDPDQSRRADAGLGTPAQCGPGGPVLG